MVATANVMLRVHLSAHPFVYLRQKGMTAHPAIARENVPEHVPICAAVTVFRSPVFMQTSDF